MTEFTVDTMTGQIIAIDAEAIPAHISGDTLDNNFQPVLVED
jgi:hypothetical protein